MKPSDAITWRLTRNTVEDRAINLSLTHSSAHDRNLLKRTKIVNNILRRASAIQTSYSKYMHIKTSVLKSIDDFVDKDDCSSLSDNDYETLYNSVMYPRNDTANSSKHAEATKTENLNHTSAFAANNESSNDDDFQTVNKHLANTMDRKEASSDSMNFAPSTSRVSNLNKQSDAQLNNEIAKTIMEHYQNSESLDAICKDAQSNTSIRYKCDSKIQPPDSKESAQKETMQRRMHHLLFSKVKSPKTSLDVSRNLTELLDNVQSSSNHKCNAPEMSNVESSHSHSFHMEPTGQSTPLHNHQHVDTIKVHELVLRDMTNQKRDDKGDNKLHEGCSLPPNVEKEQTIPEEITTCQNQVDMIPRAELSTEQSNFFYNSHEVENSHRLSVEENSFSKSNTRFDDFDNISLTSTSKESILNFSAMGEPQKPKILSTEIVNTRYKIKYGVYHEELEGTSDNLCEVYDEPSTDPLSGVAEHNENHQKDVESVITKEDIADDAECNMKDDLLQTIYDTEDVEPEKGMLHSDTRRLQQLKQLNLTADDESSTSEDEQENVWKDTNMEKKHVDTVVNTKDKCKQMQFASGNNTKHSNASVCNQSLYKNSGPPDILPDSTRDKHRANEVVFEHYAFASLKTSGDKNKYTQSDSGSVSILGQLNMENTMQEIKDKSNHEEKQSMESNAENLNFEVINGISNLIEKHNILRDNAMISNGTQKDSEKVNISNNTSLCNVILHDSLNDREEQSNDEIQAEPYDDDLTNTSPLRTSIPISLDRPSEADSLRYVLQVLKKRQNTMEHKIVESTQKVSTSLPSRVKSLSNLNDSIRKSPKIEEERRDNYTTSISLQEYDKANSRNNLVTSRNSDNTLAPSTTYNSQRPNNLQDFMDEYQLVQEEPDEQCPFTFKDITDDDELYILNIPCTVLLNELQGKKFVVKGNKLKIGKMKYEVCYKKEKTLSCVFKTGKTRKPYKTVKIRPVETITAKRKLPHLGLQAMQDNNTSSGQEKVCFLELDDKEKLRRIKKQRY